MLKEKRLASERIKLSLDLVEPTICYMAQLYSSLTVGYSDSEDRLWLRFVRDGGEAKLWMTRRLAMALLDQSYGLMNKGPGDKDCDQEHFEAVQEFIRSQGDPAPARTPAGQIDIQSALVTSVDISVSDGDVLWTFIAAQGRVGFRGSRIEAHRILEIFWLRMRSAGWRDRPPWTSVAQPSRSSE